jgi:hypothetical protein
MQGRDFGSHFDLGHTPHRQFMADHDVVERNRARFREEKRF